MTGPSCSISLLYCWLAVGPVATPETMVVKNPQGGMQKGPPAQHEVIQAHPEGHSLSLPQGTTRGSAHAMLALQKHDASGRWWQRQIPPASEPQTGVAQSAEHSLQTGEPWANAGVLRLVSTGAVQAIAAPAPIRFSILRREMLLSISGVSGSISQSPPPGSSSPLKFPCEPPARAWCVRRIFSLATSASTLRS